MNPLTSVQIESILGRLWNPALPRMNSSLGRENEVPIKQGSVDSRTPHAEFSASLGPAQASTSPGGLDRLPSPHLQLDLHVAWSKMAL